LCAFKYIHESTLGKKLLENRDVPTPTRLARKSTFSKEVETELKDYVLTLAKLFYGLPPKELRRIAFRYAENHEIAYSFNREQAVAGKDLLYEFIKRNPDVTLRQPEETSLNRITAFNGETKLCFSIFKKLWMNLNWSQGKLQHGRDRHNDHPKEVPDDLRCEKYEEDWCCYFIRKRAHNNWCFCCQRCWILRCSNADLSVETYDTSIAKE